MSLYDGATLFERCQDHVVETIEVVNVVARPLLDIIFHGDSFLWNGNSYDSAIIYLFSGN